MALSSGLSLAAVAHAAAACLVQAVFERLSQKSLRPRRSKRYRISSTENRRPFSRLGGARGLQTTSPPLWPRTALMKGSSGRSEGTRKYPAPENASVKYTNASCKIPGEE